MEITEFHNLNSLKPPLLLLLQYRELWCGCNGDPNGTHRSVLISQALDRLHEGAWLTGGVYVSVVVFLYCVTVTHLLYSSGTCRWVNVTNLLYFSSTCRWVIVTHLLYSSGTCRWVNVTHMLFDAGCYYLKLYECACLRVYY